jgi:hypothetical protein
MSGNTASNSQLGLFEGYIDIGRVVQAGSSRYDAVDQSYRLASMGSDSLHCLWKRMQGDFILHARASLPGRGTGEGIRLGWSVRSSLAEDSPYVSAVLHGGHASLEVRRVPSGPVEQVQVASGADVVQLEHKGSTYRLSVARFGDPFARSEVSGIELGTDLFACLFASPGGEEVLFDNVRIVVPAPHDAVPYRDMLGSHLEILDVESGHRRIVYSSEVPFEAPNWTPDGKALIYNSAGRLYRFDLGSGTPQVIDTGFATRNNNDHVLSFDGTMLGISNHSEEDGGNSIVYTLPVDGGTPKRITALGPSYLHGWSPDGRFLVYTGMRGGDGDIYRIAADGGEETRLTSALGLDDGSEYSPDGEYIYFNSVRSGRMQIWRMRPDGSDQEQVTDDEFNNWFAHISPDGQQMVFLSYGQDVAPGDHPPYKHVYLRMLPVSGLSGEGTQPRVIAYVYGGQGTINVPSWSPDSQRLAFVSNTAFPAGTA